MSAEGATTERHAMLLALAELLCPSLNGPSSYRLSRLVESGCLDTDRPPAQPADSEAEWIARGLARIDAGRARFWRGALEELRDRGIHMVDTADISYPVNLRMVHNSPPFILVRGSLCAGDELAVAVVGTRAPSEEGRSKAFEIARELAEEHVTVVSGLARGIDTSAHSGALSAGGRTIAVFGTGIDVVYPANNRSLAGAISRSGACISQFWPSMRGARWTFPARNIVTSGLALGTIVVEAGDTSGARLQAEAALMHGKRVFLPRQLVTAHEWAETMAGRAGVMVMDSVDQVIDSIAADLDAAPTVLV